MKESRKGFTIVELVIVIAVVAVLAAVAIPTFASIVKKTNVSADTQAVRNMNIILASESAGSSAPALSATVRSLLAGNGITDFSPKTRFYTYYWLEDENVILLADEGDRPVYPEECLYYTYSTDNWHALDTSGSLSLPPRPEVEDAREMRTFTVSFTQSGSSVTIPFEKIPTTVREGGEFELDICLPLAFQTDPRRYTMQKVTVIMSNGATEHKIEYRSHQSQITTVDNSIPFAVDESAEIRIHYVTGNIEINVDVVEYTHVTFKCELPDGGYFERVLPIGKNHNTRVECDSFCRTFLDEHKIVSAKAVRNGEDLGELYNKRFRWISLSMELLASDLEVHITVEENE